MTHYEVLGLASTATAAQVRERYVQRIAELRAAIASGGNPDPSQLDQLRSAHKVLSDPVLRAAYDASIAPRTPRTDSSGPSAVRRWRHIIGRYPRPWNFLLVSVLLVAAAVITLLMHFRTGDFVLWLARSLDRNPGAPSCTRELKGAETPRARLLAAARCGSLDEVKKQLDAGTDVNVREERGHNLGRAPLHYAAGEGHVTIIGYLISKGADANAQASTGYTPLHVAAGRGRASAVRTLLAAGANPNALDVRGGPLHAAVLQGHAKVVVLLLDAKADPNLRREHDGRTPLHMFGHIATFYPDHVSIIETLLKRGADPMAVDKQGKTPLEIAHLEAAQHILLLGGIPKQMDPFLLTARAAATHKKAPLEFLEQRGIPLDAVSRFGDNALHSAVGHGDSDGTEALEFLLSRGLDVHADSDRRGTPLHLAVESCNYKAVRILLAAGANPSFTARHGEAPLHAIFGNGFRNYTERNTCKLAVAALLDAGADVKIVNRDGRTPLHALAGVPGIRERILRAGADPRAKDARGRTPLHEARTDSAAAIQFLVEAGADPRARDRVGRTPLHEMINNGPDTVEALVKAGADPNAQDENGSTPLHIYAEEGAWADEPHTAVALVKAGARLDIRDRHGRTAAEAFVLSPWGKNAYPVNKYGKLLAVLRGEAGGG